MALEMGCRLELGKKKVSIRKPDLAVILHSNPVEAKLLDRFAFRLLEEVKKIHGRTQGERGGTQRDGHPL